MEKLKNTGDVVDPQDDDVVTQIEDGDGPEHMTVRVGVNIKFRRLDRYLQGRFSQFSRTLIQKLIKEDAVKVNGDSAKPSYQLNPGELIDLILPPPEVKEILGEPIPLNIIYEDDDLIVINKQANLIVHPARGYKNGTLVNGLVHYAKQLSSGSEEFRPGIVHRLDRNTTGVMVIAKNDVAHWRIAKQFEERKTKKFYLAIIQGMPDLVADCINKPIGTCSRVREKQAVRADGKNAITFYEVIERFKGYSLVKVNIKTGRTHQIRVHFSHIKHPVVGDDMYGGKNVYPWQMENRDSCVEEPIMNRTALHAWMLTITHPTTGKEITFEAPLPDDMQILLEELRKHRAM